jgi:hypothetical protein
MFELRVTPSYYPNVDSEFSGATPFAQLFGNNPRIQVGAEGDYEALHFKHFASLGVGGLIGFTTMSGTVLPSNPAQTGGQTIQEQTGFTLWTFAALAVLRIDVLARETWLPIVPYAKAGPAVGLWTTSNGSGTSVYHANQPDSQIGRGKSGGMIYALGGMVLLDAFDPHAAKSFTVERGINHSYAFVEYTIAQLDGLAQTNAMHVGDKAFTFGLAFEL